MILKIINDSEHTFLLDGEWLKAGSWKSDKSPPIASHAETQLEFSQTMEGLSAVIWWVNAEQHDVYLSLAFSWPRLGHATFICHAGIPPANLKAELDTAPRLEKGSEESKVSNIGCEWFGTATGVTLRILTELPHFMPHAAADDAVQEATQSSADNLWTQTRPRDAADGLLRGITTVGASVAGGLAAAVVAPVAGARQGGALGFAKGLGMGIFGGATLAVGGTVCGVAQIGRGIMQAPVAYRARKEEKVWDQEMGQWVDVDLCAMERELAAADHDDFENRTNDAAAVQVAETEYYDLLSITPGASPSEIKKAYYKVARQLHPDKNPDNAEATAKFQELSTVYQVLSDPEQRKKYDREGKAGMQEQKTLQMDPTAFFSLLFGSERFVSWTGELHIAMQADHFHKSAAAEEDDEKLYPEGDAAKSLKRRQLRREVMCACHLRDKLERFIYGRDAAGFEEQMRLEAHDLAGSQFGPELLQALGEIYQIRAEIYLANELKGRFSLSKRVASAKHTGLVIRHSLCFYKNAAGSVLHAKRVYNAAKAMDKDKGGELIDETPGKEEREQEQAKKMEVAMDNALPQFMQTAWAYVTRDIDSTVKMVSRKFLQDKSVPWQIRVRRGQGLHRLGQIFSEEGLKAAATAATESSVGAASTGAVHGVAGAEGAKAALQEALMGAMREKK